MRYQIRQRVFSLGGAFDITDDLGNAVYRVQGELLSLGNSLTLYDAQNERLAHIQQRLLTWTPTYDITRGGMPALTVHKQAFSWTPHFDIEGPAGMYTMDGDWSDWNFQIDSMGQTVALISRQYAMFSECYGIEIAEGADDPTVLCLAIVMDEIINAQ
jgi:uncharacterized protein YxjI